MSAPARLTTRLSPKWLMKMTLFLALLVGLGIWSAVDAFSLYPARGRHHADFMLKAYLECLNRERRLLAAASVEDPAAELERLQQANAAQSRSCDAARAAWLLSLSRIENLSRLTQQNREAIARQGGPIGVDTRTMFSRPQSVLDELTARLGTRNTPKPLAAYDIPLQYVLMVIGFGGALWLLLFLARARSISYSFDPEEKRLFIPGGRSFVPADVKDVDKRDWHKYYLYLTLNDGSAEMKFDLLRYSPLEEWLLEIERLHPNYVPPPPDNAGTVAAQESPEEPASAS